MAPLQTLTTPSPDEHTLVLPHAPERGVDFVGDGVDVWREVAQLLVHVALHNVQAVHTLHKLVRVHGRKDGANECLKGGDEVEGEERRGER